MSRMALFGLWTLLALLINAALPFTNLEKKLIRVQAVAHAQSVSTAT